MTVLPRGLKPEDFARAISQLQAVVGPQWVFTSEEDVGLYRDAYSVFMGEPEEIMASAAVAPESVAQVQAIMKIANAFKLPIYPISTGKNLGYGGSAPNFNGSVVLDLKRMNKIIEVDDKRHFAVVEPGVSYFDLYRYVQERGLKVMLDVPETGWGSLVGNSLEHGVGYTTPEMRDHFGSHCGMEVVLPNGELLRTGMGAVPGSNAWQSYRYGYGPHVDGLFAQSNFGVVTKMGFWLSPLPDAYRLDTVTVPRRGDLPRFVEIVNHLENAGIFNGWVEYTCPAFAGKLSVDRNPELKALMSKKGGATPAELEAWAARHQKPYWGANLEFYGPAKVIAAQWEYAKEKLSELPGAKFEEVVKHTLPLTPAEQEQEPFLPSFGIPSLSAFDYGALSEYNPTPNRGHVWLSPVVQRSGDELLKCQTVFGDVAREVGLDLHIGPATLPLPAFKRTFVFLFGVPVQSDPKVNRENREKIRRAIKIFAEHGWAEYRAAPAFQDDVMQTYSFNNHALRRFHETLKDAVDPNGILSAGRYGIWPKHLRGAR
jgi:FAD/FMN-containing dehydrogenase